MPRVLVGGYFDPLHPGHLDTFRFAKNCVEDAYVIVVIHRVEEIIAKSKFYILKPEELAVLLREYTQWINAVVLSVDTDGTVTKTLKVLRPDIFVKGPDRNPQNMPPTEVAICNEIGCKIIFQTGEKINNSSSIKQRIIDQFKNM